MRVVHLSSYPRGGAAVAAMRLHRSLLAAGVDSSFLTGEPAPGVRALARMPARRLFSKPREKPLAVRHFSTNLDPLQIAQQVRNYRADIVHLHWIGDGFVSLDAMPDFGVPVVWTHHDLWAATGGCHYAGTCRGFEQQCGNCPALAAEARSENDASRIVWSEKRRLWKGWSPTSVAPSHWLADELKTSSLFRGRQVAVIPYGLDLSVYRPMRRAAAREVLGLPADKMLILFGAVASTTDPRKGYAQLREALTLLPSGLRERSAAVVFGSDTVTDLTVDAMALGTLNDDITLALAYAAADVVVVPSLEDNFPNIVLEAMACGRTVVAFGCGGIPEAIEQGVTGWTVPVGNAAALGAAITAVLDDAAGREKTERKARAKAEGSFAAQRQAADYLALYSKLA